MATSQWYKLYTATVAAPPKTLFGLVADMPSYGRWLSRSDQFAETTDVEPYPVQLGSRYHDGKPQEPGTDWWGTVTGFQPPGSLDFHHTIQVRQLRATVDVHIHYSFEPDRGVTRSRAGSSWRSGCRCCSALSDGRSSPPSTRRTSGRWPRSRPMPRHTPTTRFIQPRHCRRSTMLDLLTRLRCVTD
jgi:hypothetical protein